MQIRDIHEYLEAESFFWEILRTYPGIQDTLNKFSKNFSHPFSRRNIRKSGKLVQFL